VDAKRLLDSRVLEAILADEELVLTLLLGHVRVRRVVPSVNFVLAKLDALHQLDLRAIFVLVRPAVVKPVVLLQNKKKIEIT
jgi:hypothetical protein